MRRRIRRVRKGAPGNGPVATPAPRPGPTLLRAGWACICTGYRGPVVRHQVHGVLPAIAGPDASADERGRAIVARMVARHGAPSIEDYRRVYTSCGVPWPGDEEIRRRYPVGPAA